MNEQKEKILRREARSQTKDMPTVQQYDHKLKQLRKEYKDKPISFEKNIYPKRHTTHIKQSVAQ